MIVRLRINGHRVDGFGDTVEDAIAHGINIYMTRFPRPVMYEIVEVVDLNTPTFVRRAH